MSHILLFVTAKSAEQLALQLINGDLTTNPKWFALAETCLVETTEVSGRNSVFTDNVKDGIVLDNEFLGASEDECQTWALEQMDRFSFLDRDFIVILDERSAAEGTVLVKYFHDFPSFELEWANGPLPPRRYEWYPFRIAYHEIPEVHHDLLFAPPLDTYPVYFELSQYFTDENGIFNVQQAYQFQLAVSNLSQID
ncbi:hypothetical protein F4777DRAFT_581166 [Nemania sp. FL0916]|nr:hypothetical protein F4777DRAFT_581166 [Nemania sp. FL0916]